MRPFLLSALLLALVSAEGQECVISVTGKPPADLNMETWKPCPIPWIISERQVPNAPSTVQHNQSDRLSSGAEDVQGHRNAKIHEFRVMQPYHPKPNRFLAAIKRHPKVFIGLSLAIGGGTGWFIDHETSVNCKEYGPGKNGVLAHCP